MNLDRNQEEWNIKAARADWDQAVLDAQTKEEVMVLEKQACIMRKKCEEELLLTNTTPEQDKESRVETRRRRTFLSEKREMLRSQRTKMQIRLLHIEEENGIIQGSLQRN